MVELGMPPMEAIQSATSRAAIMLDMDGKLGIVAPGAFADIIAVSGDPLQDIKALGKRAVRDERRQGLQERRQPGNEAVSSARRGRNSRSRLGRSKDFSNFVSISLTSAPP